METMRIHLGSVDQIPLGQGRCFMVGEYPVGIFRLRDGRLFAIENRCPHLGGPLADGIVGGTQVVCPLHGHKFDFVTGKGSEGHECVRTYKVFTENNNVVLTFVFPKLSAEKKNCHSTV